MTRGERAWVCLALTVGIVHGFLALCWDLSVDRDKSLDRRFPRG